MNRLFIIAVLLLSACLLQADDSRRSLVVLNIQGAIGPATSDFVSRSLASLDIKQTELVVLKLDTPGGLDTAMREIVKEILSSPVPIVSYVTPTGARAASAGTFIMYASHVAAMAPATNLGAATPVPISGPISMPGGDKAKDLMPQKNAKTNKAINDAIAYIRGLAETRGRNIEWAESAISDAASLSANEALKKNVIDLVADNLDELLVKLNGREISLEGNKVRLNTSNLEIKEIEPDWRSEFLSIITNPNIAYILMLIGIYGIIFELANPGTIVSGVIGAISLLLALFAFQVLDVNFAGLALMILGIVMMVGEAFAPSFGALGIGGIIAFVTGSIILMDTDVPGFGISPALIGSIALVSATAFTFVVGFAIRARNRPIVIGQEEIVGSTGLVISSIEGEGKVRFEGEIWNAISPYKIPQGQKVRVTKIEGLVLTVEPVEEETHGN